MVEFQIFQISVLFWGRGVDMQVAELFSRSLWHAQQISFFFSARHGGSSKGFPGSNLHAQQISDFSASNENVFKTTLSMPINNILIFFFCVVSNRQIILCGCLSFLFNMQWQRREKDTEFRKWPNGPTDSSCVQGRLKQRKPHKEKKNHIWLSLRFLLYTFLSWLFFLWRSLIWTLVYLFEPSPGQMSRNDNGIFVAQGTNKERPTTSARYAVPTYRATLPIHTTLRYAHAPRTSSELRHAPTHRVTIRADTTPTSSFSVFVFMFFSRLTHLAIVLGAEWTK